jgi:hypothetical protein
VAGNEFPVNVAPEKTANMFILIGAISSEENQILDVANTGHQVNTQEVREREDGGALRLGVTM